MLLLLSSGGDEASPPRGPGPRNGPRREVHDPDRRIALVGALLASVREVLRVAPRTSPQVPTPVLLVPSLERLPDTAEEQKEEIPVALPREALDVGRALVLVRDLPPRRYVVARGSGRPRRHGGGGGRGGRVGRRHGGGGLLLERLEIVWGGAGRRREQEGDERWIVWRRRYCLKSGKIWGLAASAPTATAPM